MANLISTIRATLLASSLMLAACSVSNRTVLIINVENEKWRIASVSAYQTDQGWIVKGKLSAPNRFGIPKGNVLISIIGEQNELIESKTVSYRRVSSSAGRHLKHQYGSALFSTHFKSIPVNTTVVAELKLHEKHEI